MQAKTLRISYWVATIVFAQLLVMDGLGGIARAQAGVDVLQHLGYPLYMLPMTGVAKVLAAIAILQTKFRTPKEWAFAGWAFTCIGAFVSRAAVGDTAELVYPVVFLAIAAVPYWLWLRAREAGLVT